MARLRVAHFAIALLLASLLPSSLPAQTSKTRAAVRSQPKLTPTQQVGLSILKQQAGVAKGLPPATRTFALLEIARGFEKLDRPKALAALRDAFQASQAMEEARDQHPSAKTQLQAQIVRQLVHLDPAYCERLVPQLSGSAKAQAIDGLVKYHTQNKQFAQAIALLDQLGDEQFPYLAVANLLQALPPEMAADKQNLFAQALASYSRHGEHSFGPDEFGVFIGRSWQGLPPDLVLQAIDEVLKQARQSDSKMEITVGAEKGAASFSSTYEYSLFELMPVLRALDPERADRLLQEDRELQNTVKQFPNGLQSLDPGKGTPNSISMRLPDSGGSPAEDRYAAELESRTQQILAQANQDPKQALAAAMSLPDFHNIRAMALLRLAETILKSGPTYAGNALDELMKIIPSVQQDVMRAGLLSGAGDDYLKLGDTDSAKKVVDQGFKLAEKLYASDTDADDPNQAFKAQWPSTDVWGRFVSLAARISPQTALQAINGIGDPEIQSLETIALANSLLGAPSGAPMVAVKKKSQNMFMMGAPQ